jgi:hypothetical protein
VPGVAEQVADLVGEAVGLPRPVVVGDPEQDGQARADLGHALRVHVGRRPAHRRHDRTHAPRYHPAASVAAAAGAGASRSSTVSSDRERTPSLR